MRGCLWCCIAVLFMGCGVFRNSSRAFVEEELLVNQKTTLKLDEERVEVEGLRIKTQFKDSTGLSYAVEIWPKGSFSFDHEHGFSGEATKVLIHGKADKLLTAESKEERKRFRNASKVVQMENAEKLKKRNTEKVSTSNLSWKWLVLLFFVILCLIVRTRLYRIARGSAQAFF